MLPETTIPFRLDNGRVLPGFLDERDVPWLRVLVEEFDRFQGRPARDLRERLRQPLPCATPHFKRRAAVALLLRLWKSASDAQVPPGQTREALFRA